MSGEPHERTTYLVVALDCERPTSSPSRHRLDEVAEVHIGRAARQACEREGTGSKQILRLSLSCERLSSSHARLKKHSGQWTLTDAGSKNGTFVDGVAVSEAVLRDGTVIEVGRMLLLFRDGVSHDAGATEEPDDLQVEPDDPRASLSLRLRAEYRKLNRVAASQLPVLILGETGTGKERAARAVHDCSGRSGAFVPVNCGALAESLVESELFGHSKGAYSGAHEDRAGLVASAEAGTLFLDEVAELAPPSQVALLRVLQEGEVRPVGGHKTRVVDVRFVAATLRDLRGQASSNSFREDLYARLAGHVVNLPALRERREDIGLVIAFVLGADVAGKAWSLERAAARALFAYHWPHNVRELEQALRAAMALAPQGQIRLADLPEAVRSALVPGSPDAAEVASEDATLFGELTELLSRHRGNVRAVARECGKAPMQVYRWLKRLGIDPADYRNK